MALMHMGVCLCIKIRRILSSCSFLLVIFFFLFCLSLSFSDSRSLFAPRVSRSHMDFGMHTMSSSRKFLCHQIAYFVWLFLAYFCYYTWESRPKQQCTCTQIALNSGIGCNGICAHSIRVFCLFGCIPFSLFADSPCVYSLLRINIVHIIMCEWVRVYHRNAKICFPNWIIFVILRMPQILFFT